jgi:MoaD family protein
MIVSVEYFAQAREAAGRSREMVELPQPCTVQALIDRLARERGERLASLLLGPDGRLAVGVLLAVRGRQVARPGDERPVDLRDGDEVLVMPAVSGG